MSGLGKQKDYFQFKSKHLALVIGFFSLILYSNTFSHGYVLDDHSVILNHSHVQEGVDGISKILTTNYRHGQGGFNDGLYRPLSLITFALEWEWFPGSPGLSHFINIMIYALSCGLLFLAMVAIFNKYPLVISFSISLLFLSHPLHTEVVANIKGRDELLAFFGFAACLYFFSRSALHNKPKDLVLGGLFYGIALFSKESAVTYALIIPLMLLMNKAVPKKKVIRITAFLLIFALGFLALHNQIIQQMEQPVDPGNFSLLNNPIAATKDAALKWGSTFALQTLFLQKLILPFPLVHDYSYHAIPLTNLSDFQSILGGLILLLLTFLSLWGILKRNQWGLIGGIYLLSIGVASQLIRPIGVQFAERLLFLSVLPLSMAVVFGINRILKRKNYNIPLQKKILTISVMLFLVFSLLSFQRNKAWESNLSLYQNDIEQAAQSARANYNLGTELSEVAKNTINPNEKRKMLEDAATYLRKAIQIYPDYLDAYNNLGIVYSLLEQPEKAIQVYLANIKNDPDYSKNYYNLATAYQDAGKLQLALQSMAEYVKRNPENPDAYFLMGRIAGELKNFEQAAQYLEQANQLAGANRPAILNYLGMSYGMLGKHQRAEQLFRKAVNLSPGNGEFLMNLAMSLGHQAKTEQEIQILRQLVRLNPNHHAAQDRLRQLGQ